MYWVLERRSLRSAVELTRWLFERQSGLRGVAPLLRST